MTVSTARYTPGRTGRRIEDNAWHGVYEEFGQDEWELFTRVRTAPVTIFTFDTYWDIVLTEIAREWSDSLERATRTQEAADYQVDDWFSPPARPTRDIILNLKSSRSAKPAPADSEPDAIE